MAHVRQHKYLVDGLHEFCKIATKVVGAGVMVEVGSAFGEAAEIFAGYFSTVYAVDCWEGLATRMYGLPEVVEKEFDQRTIKHPNIVKVKAISPQAAELFRDIHVDLVYIDADHGYEAVRADIKAWLPIAQKLIGGHDYAIGKDGVTRAVNERFSAITRTKDTSWLVYL